MGLGSLWAYFRFAFCASAITFALQCHYNATPDGVTVPISTPARGGANGSGVKPGGATAPNRGVSSSSGSIAYDLCTLVRNKPRTDTLNVWKSPKEASITASNRSRSSARKHCASCARNRMSVACNASSGVASADVVDAMDMSGMIVIRSRTPPMARNVNTSMMHLPVARGDARTRGRDEGRCASAATLRSAWRRRMIAHVVDGAGPAHHRREVYVSPTSIRSVSQKDKLIGKHSKLC